LDFGLGENFFVFVGNGHFHERFPHRLPGPVREREYRSWVIPRAQVRAFYVRSVPHNEFKHDENGRLVNHGIGLERMKVATQGRVAHSGFDERHPRGDRTIPEGPRPTGPVRSGVVKQSTPANPIFRPPPPHNSSGATKQGTTKSSGGASGGTAKSGGGGTSKDTKKSP
jgi:uncharacterized membrane protein YgcG